ncbi:pilus assembly PilX family protein [Tepidimonas charontis]|uniref:Type 4 fimbrial biogenesis protein PilX N-terminal domain-containing protein n=1 Tax=Tepidimonas charontis TaxID=2267262 RepID=A0A554XFS3_9BURK|nr:PilX N-terminal domain-containing pilus assembly protein [Tepidimonas charontis]TSE34687.1 hypothetical protein Tchar_01191 [Tepidimonas charontis]
MALIVALVMLAAMTIVGAATLRTATIEQKAANATQDRSLAFAAAETALRFGETVASAQAMASPVNIGFPAQGLSTVTGGNGCTPTPCAAGLCEPPDPDCPPRWLDSAFTGWVNATPLGGVIGTPQYFVEFIGLNFPCSDGGPSDPRNCKRYRITARSIPSADRSVVILQSVYASE